ncbi:MAG: aminotransferase class I/II-fold pyridoxal phosphate-dependent enzyme [Vicinamibacteria bacterium]|jgi:threonine aldolase|nr:aminotransferase class I/II-fold pyridoxal phosphate-dependent enzyme [Vicinamibacteria bacterium]
MPHTVVDMRSDTVTRPTPEMRRAMAEAEVGDDVMGEDPTVNALSARAAEWLGKEDALFVASGTMGNQIAIAIQARPGDEVICERTSHVFRWEGGAMAAIAHAQTVPLDGQRGVLRAEQVLSALRTLDDVHHPHTAVVSLECSHNFGGGRVYPLDEIRRIADAVRPYNVRMHLDGARMFNACATGAYTPAELAAPFDTIMFCLSKGLGTPVGSMLVGDRATIARARRVRKRLGGGWRQAGILAAAGLYALDHHVERLRDDNARARRLSERLAAVDGISARPRDVETNILFFSAGSPARDAALEHALAERSVLVEGGGHFPWIRAVTHLDIDDADLDRCVAEVARAVQGLPAS